VRFQRAQNTVCRTGLFSRRVKVVNADQPAAVVVFGVEV
jgi:hypothetical protein